MLYGSGVHTAYQRRREKKKVEEEKGEKESRTRRPSSSKEIKETMKGTALY